MKPVICALAAMMCGAIMNLVVSQKMRVFSPVVNQTIMYVCIMCFTVPFFLIWKKVVSAEVVTPDLSLLPYYIGAGLMVIGINYLLFSAYSAGGSIATITAIMALVPVAAMVMNAIIERSMPSGTQICGVICAVAAVWLVSR